MCKSPVRFALFGLVVLAMLLAACAPAATQAPTQAPAPTQPPAPTSAPAATQPPAPTEAPATVAPTTAPTAAVTNTATPVPEAKCDALPNPPTVNAGDLGSEDNPIVMAFVPSGDSGKIATASTAIADCLNKMTGLSYKVQTGTSYGPAIEAMGANKAQVGFLSTFSVLIAENKYGVIPALANMRNYSTVDIDPDKDLKGQLEPFYKGQFIANVNSGIKTFADLKGKTFCFVDPNSASGYIIPRIVLKANGIDPDKDFKAAQNAGSHPNVAVAVYKGDCDAGVTFIDVRTDKAANLQANTPISQTKSRCSRRLTASLMTVSSTSRPWIQSCRRSRPMPCWRWLRTRAVRLSLPACTPLDAFQKIDATFYQDFAAVVKKAGVDPATLVK